MGGFVPIAMQYRPIDVMESLDKAQQRRALKQEEQLRGLQVQEQQLRMAALQKQQAQQSALESAYAGAIKPQQASYSEPAMQLGGMSLPGREMSVSGPMALDRNALYSNLAQSAPQMLPDIQAKFAASDAAARQQALEEATKRANLGKTQAETGKINLDTAAKHIDLVGQAANSLLALDDQTASQQYPTTLQMLRAQGVDTTGAPQQWDRNAVQTLATQAMSVKDQIAAQQAAAKAKEDNRHNVETEKLTRRGQDMTNARAREANATAAGNVDAASTTVDPTSQSILAQTGLSLNAFRVLTGQSQQLPRDKFTRAAAAKEAQDWANKHGIDISTMASQYKANNDVLASNISRMANTKIMENELQGTIDNLKQVASDKDLGNLKFANVVKIWGGQQVNDELAQQYAMHLNQLRNELAAYNAATQGRTGNSITVQDVQEAERTIQRGIATGGLNGLAKAVESSTQKMGSVMQGSVDAANRSVWDLFGVGQNYKAKGQAQPQAQGGVQVTDPRGVVHTFPNQQAADAFKQAAGIR